MHLPIVKGLKSVVLTGKGMQGVPDDLLCRWLSLYLDLTWLDK